uniref:Uncharacterized protein n=1 Tax=Glossina palpalis gambiensis TaxID=67801 RepID=A0A1B0BXB4_9MUSC
MNLNTAQVLKKNVPDTFDTSLWKGSEFLDANIVFLAYENCSPNTFNAAFMLFFFAVLRIGSAFLKKF